MTRDTRLDVANRARKAGNWIKRSLQGAVLVAVAASVPSVWSAGGVQINNVAVGAAAMSQHGSVTTVRTTSHTTVINYQRLSVGAGETLQFLQPSASSRVLNRIQGSEPTRIDGTLLSNGRVYMVNPAGVMFGNGAVINVAGLYAAAGHISDQNFVAGNNLFTGNTGTVENAGLIQARQVHLVGQNVVNSGRIEAGGTGAIVTLTAGKDVYLGETTSPTGETGVLVRVSADTTATHESTGVTNSGTINAGRGQLAMGAGDLYAAGILNSGSLKGRGITLNANKNTTVSNGAIDAASNTGQGGKVELLGDRVAVNGLVDASGPDGGGVIHVGGEYHGGGDTPAASQTFIGLNGVLKADATVSGNGGEIIVWANEVTRYFGNISAQGGAQGGNGGFVEVSGKNNLVFAGGVNTAAPRGWVGTLLLDPASIDVNSSGTASFDNLTDVDQFSDANGSPNNRIDPGTIANATANVVLQATGDITFSDVVLMDTIGVGITARAGGNITVNADLRTRGGAIVLSAGDSAAGGGFNPNGLITVANSQTISSTNGQAGADITLRAHDVVLASGSLSCNIGSGTGTAFFVTNNPSTAINIGGSGGYNLTPGELDAAAQTCANVVIGEQGVQTGAITWDAAADWSYNPVSGADRTTTVRLNTSAAITIAGDLAPDGGNDHINLVLFGSAISTSGALNLVSGNFFSGGTTYTGTGAISTSGEINILHSGAVSLQAALNATSAGTVRLAGSTITESGAGSITAGQLAVRSTGNVTLNGTNAIVAFGAVDTAANSTVTVANSVGINYSTTTAAVVPAGFTAFNAVSGISTNNGNTSLTVNGEMTLNNPIATGTGALTLTTTAAGIQGSGANTASGGDITLNAATGIGTTAAPVLAPTGNISLTTAGANAAGNISVTFFTTASPGTLATSKLTTLVTDAATPQDIAFTVNGNVSIDSAFTITDDTGIRITAPNGTIQGDGNATHTLTAPVITLSALGIGTATAVNLSPATSAVISTTGTAAAGNINLTTSTALTSFLFNTDNATPQAVTIEAAGALDVTANLLLEVGDTLGLHAGSSGTGDLTFSGAPTLRADGIELWAGKGDGSAATAFVDFSTLPTMANQAGSGPPATLTIRQDAPITDATLTTAAFTGAALPANYTLRSDGGNVTINTAANIAGTGLTLVASKSNDTVNINIALTGGNAPASLTANAATVILAADVNTAGAQAYNGALQLNANTTLTATDITLNGPVNSQLSGFFSLTTVGSGTVWFQGNAGGTPGAGNELGSLDSTGAGITQFGSGGNTTVVTKETPSSDGHVLINGNVSLHGNTTIIATTTTAMGSLLAGTADVTLVGTVNSQASGDFALTVSTPGVTWFKGNIGNESGGALGGVTTDAQGGLHEQTLLGNGAAVAITTASPITFNDDVILMADTTLSAANPLGDVTFASTVKSDAGALWTLSIAAGNSIWFQSNVGAGGGELGAITTSGTGTLKFGTGGLFVLTTLEDTVAKANATGAHNFGNNIVLNGNIILNAESTKPVGLLNAGEDDITFGGTIASSPSSLSSLFVAAPGVTWFKGGVSATAGEELGAITTDFEGGLFELAKFGASGDISVITKSGSSATGAQTYNDEVLLTGNTTFRGDSLAFNASPTSLDAGAFNVTLAGNAMSFAGGTNSVQGTGDLTIQPLLDADAIVLGRPDPAPVTANTLFLSLTDLAAFKNGFHSIAIGSPTGTHAITISSNAGAPFDPVAFNDPVTIQGGSITVDASDPLNSPGLYGADNASVTLHAPNITLNASVLTDGNDILVNGNVILGSPVEVVLKSNSAGATNLGGVGLASGNIMVTGTIDDDGNPTLLYVHAGTLGTLGNIDLQGAIGGTTPVNGFAANGDDLRLHASLFTTGPGFFTGLIQIQTNSITLAGNVTPSIPATITIDTDSSGGTLNAGSFTATGVPINHLAGTGDVNLVIDTSAGTGHSGAAINLGIVTGLNDLTLTAGSAGVTVAGATLTGAFDSSGAAFDSTGAISAAGVAIDHTGAVTVGDDINSPANAVAVTGATIHFASGAPVTGLTVALNDTGGVTIDDLVTAANGFSGIGAGSSAFTLNTGAGITTTNANVTITHAGGLVTLDGAIAAGTGVVAISGHGITTDLGGTIVGGSVTLAGNAAAIALNDDLTGSGPVSITGSTINVFLGAPIHGSTVTFSDTGGVGINDVITAANGFSSVGTGISAFVLNSLGAINTTNANVTITHAGGLVTLNGPIAAGTGIVSISGLGINSAAAGTLAGGSITLAGNATPVSLHGAVTGGSAVAITGSAITNFLGAPIHGATVSLNDSAGVTINDLVTATGGFTSIGSGSSALTVNSGGGGITTTNANVTITHAGGLVTLNGPITAGTGVVSVSGLGITTGIGGSVGGGSITLAANGSPIILNDAVAGTVVVISGGTFNNTALVTGTSIKLTQSGLATLDANLSAPNIMIASAGITQSAGIINAATLAISGTGIFSLPMANTIGTLAVNLTGPLTLANATDIALGAAGSPAINGITATGDVTLTIVGTTTLSRDVTSSAGNVSINSPISVSTGSHAVSAANVTLGDLVGAGNLTLTSSGASSKITVGAIGVSPASRFGDITFQAANTVQLDGNIFAGNVAFNDALTSGARPDVPTLATIFHDGSLTIDANGSFTMEKNQKLTVHDSTLNIGDLAIKTNNHSLTVGDLAALGKITLDAGGIGNQITLVNRAPAHEILPNGLADPDLDTGTAIVAGFNGPGAIVMHGSIVVVGSSATHRIAFSAVSASADIAEVPGSLQYVGGSNLLVIPRNILSGDILHESDFVVNALVLGIGGSALAPAALGADANSPTSLQGSVIPRDVETLSPEREQAISGALRDALRELGVYARDVNTDEVLDYLVRRAMYNDLPLRLDPLPTDYTVAANRLPYAPVIPTVEAYRGLFFKQEVDASGNPVMDGGKPKMVAQDTAILNAFGQTWLQYTRDMGDNATPPGFRGYLENHDKDDPKFAAALGFLNQLRDLVLMIKGLGLTDTEFDLSRKVLLAKVRPANIKEEDFWDVVNGPTTRAGSVTALK